MKKNFIPSLLVLFACAGLLASCSSDVSTDALSATFGEPSVAVREKPEGHFTVEAKFNAVLTNRTERVMNVVFTEGTIADAQSGEALVRFRPIVPDSYGSSSTVQLFSKQTNSFPVVTPLDLYGFNPVTHPQVVIKMKYNTEGYRTEVMSGPIRVETLK